MRSATVMLRRAKQRPFTVELERIEHPTAQQRSVGARIRRFAAHAVHAPEIAKRMEYNTGIGVEDVRASTDLASLTLRFTCFPGCEGTASADLQRVFASPSLSFCSASICSTNLACHSSIVLAPCCSAVPLRNTLSRKMKLKNTPYITFESANDIRKRAAMYEEAFEQVRRELAEDDDNEGKQEHVEVDSIGNAHR
jgi:hypothetical protein